MKFRKKPVMIEAIQWTGDNFAEVVEFLGDDFAGALRGNGRDDIEVATLEGVIVASLNDWLIQGVQDEHYPCKPDIFSATYEPA